MQSSDVFRGGSYRAVLAVTALAVGLLYFACIRFSEGRPVWNSDLNGFYDLLGRAFAQGQLHLPIDPSPELLALPDPWDANRNRSYRIHDAVLFNRHYYLYHGAAPALVLFTPWRLLTKHDMPESFGVFLFCLGGYLFSSQLLVYLLSYLRVQLPVVLFALLLIVLGGAQCVPYLLERAMLYEIAIAGGYFFVMAGFYFFAKTLTASAETLLWPALAGLSFGMAIGCRPHLGLAGGFAFLVLFIQQTRLRGWRGALARRELRGFALPLAACGLAIAAYNYARFGDALEFGVRYQLGDLKFQTVHLSLASIVPGLYYLLACAPIFEPVFPFFRLAMHAPFNSTNYALPPGYFLEPIAGILPLCPLILVALAAPLFSKRLVPEQAVRMTLGAMYWGALGCILFIATTGWSTQRYAVDFLPVLLLIACVLIAILLSRLRGVIQRLATAAVTVVILYSVSANLALAIQGPYDGFVLTRPYWYTRIARLFSPVERFRPLWNPRVLVEANVAFPARDASAGGREPLVSAGEFGSRYLLSAERISADKVRLTSSVAPTLPNIGTVDVRLTPGGPDRVSLNFTPEDRVMTVRWNGETVLRHPLSFLVTAPDQILFGEERLFGNTTVFTGRVVVLQKIVGGP